MADHEAAIKKYAPKADEAAVAGLLKTYALVLSQSDSATVALSDKGERETVKKNFLGKKLGITDDAAMEKALDEVAATMKGDNHKSRAAVYYLLAEKFGKVDVFKA
ncbi:MAG: DUF2853 family protein [Propionibacteriaceae bacterium]